MKKLLIISITLGVLLKIVALLGIIISIGIKDIIRVGVVITNILIIDVVEIFYISSLS